MFKEQIIDPIMRNLFEGKDRNAFCIKDEFFTYGQLANKSQISAHYFRQENHKTKM